MDYLKSAIENESTLGKVDNYNGLPLLESTVQNIINLANIRESSEQLGSIIYQRYNQEQFNSFIEGLKKGYDNSTELDAIEKIEENKISEAIGGLTGRILK